MEKQFNFVVVVVLLPNTEIEVFITKKKQIKY